MNITKELIYNKYWIDNYTIKEIATYCGVSYGCIYKKMVKYNIPRRSRREVQLGKLNSMYGRQHTPKTIQLFRDTRGGKNNIMYGKHHTQETKDIISSKNTGKTRSDQYKKSRSITMSGKNNPMYGKRGSDAPGWRGGKSFETYCVKFNESLKEYIRDKYDRCCVLCGKSEEDNGAKLSVHHTDYNKNTFCNGKSWGLIPLCKVCHAKTHGNRYYWFNLLGNYWAIKWVIYYV